MNQSETLIRALDAEEAIVGALVCNGEAFAEVSKHLCANDFTNADCKSIYTVMDKLAKEEVLIELTAICDELQRLRLGRKSYQENMVMVGRLGNNCTSVRTYMQYVKVVKEQSKIRKIADIGKEISCVGENPFGKDADKLVSEARDILDGLASNDDGELDIATGESLKAGVERCFADIFEVYKNEGRPIGLETGYRKFDEMTGGLRAGQMITIGALAGMGKTTFATNIALYAALNTNRPVVIFSLEMPEVEILKRIIASLSAVEHKKIDKTGKISAEDWEKLASAKDLLLGTKLLIKTRGGITPYQLRAEAKEFYKEHGDCALVVVDYLGLMNVPDLKGNRVNEVSESSRCMKALAVELECPVIVLSQFNRDYSKRSADDKRPVLSDLRDSGAVEQDSDIIAFLYRESGYDRSSSDMNTEVIVAKNRSGEVGIFDLQFHSQICLFSEYK